MTTGPRRRSVWRPWLLSFAALALVMAGLRALRAELHEAHVALALLLVVLGASASGGRAVGFAVAAAAFLGFNYFFVEPYGTLGITDPLDWIVLFAFLVTSLVAAHLLARATSTADTATRRAAEVDRLASLGAETLSAPGAVEALQAIVTVIRDTIGVDACAVYRRGADGQLAHAAAAGTAPEGLVVMRGTEIESLRLASWLAEKGRGAVELADGTVRLPHDDDGASVDGMASVRYAVGEPDARAVLVPLAVREQTVGVLRIASARGVGLTAERARLLVALAYYAALGVERLRLVERAELAEAERRVESLRSALLTAVSHDLRTPLTTIKGIAHEVAHGADPARAEVIEAEADRLDGLIGDLLDLSRIQAGAVRPNVAVNTADDLVGAALQRAGGALRDREVIVDLPDDTLLAGRFDFTESLRVLVNLLENAAKYSPAGTPLRLTTRRSGDRLVFTVLDAGPGVPPAERERIFEPFYRPPGVPADVRGTGLGLSIARGLAEAQGGGVRYEALVAGGSAFILELPAADVPE